MYVIYNIEVILQFIISIFNEKNYKWGDVTYLQVQEAMQLNNAVQHYYIAQYSFFYQGIRLKTVECLLTSLLIINAFDTFSITGDLSEITESERGRGPQDLAGGCRLGLLSLHFTKGCISKS